MRRNLVILIVIALTLPGLLAALPATQGVPSLPSRDRDLLSGERGAGASLSGHSVLQMVVSDFDPLVDSVDLPQALRTTQWDGLFLIQFIGPPLPGWVDSVESIGCHLVSYIPDNGYIAVMDREARRTVVDLPYVRWVGPYHPGLRVSPDLWVSTDISLGLAVVAAGDPERLAADMTRLGGSVEVVGSRVVQGLLPRASLLGLARNGGVEWIERWLEPELHNDHSARLTGARQSSNGAWDNTTLRLWSWNATTHMYEGITGDGYIVSAADTGLDDDHPSFAGHLPTINYLGGSTTQDTYGHGTHVLGTAAGLGIPYPQDAALGDGKYIGVAPGANVFMLDIFEGFNFYRNFDVIGKDASMSGAVVNSNSWGEFRGGSYTSNEEIYDTMVRDAQPAKPGEQPMVFCFSSGNDGAGGDGTVASPASGKNIITVGATGNDKRGVSSGSVAGFSSRGPTADGRIKPDVVASGYHVVSAAAWPHSMPFDPPSDGGESWTYASGTSMSCPAVAGTVALVYDYSEHIYGYTNPSPALVKALLINGADKLTSDSVYPGTRAGWGRVNLTKLVETPNYRTYFHDQDVDLRVGGVESQRYIYAVAPGERTVKFTLVWTDYPGSPSASKALVSDLDLVVTDPQGNVYKGNNFDARGFTLVGEDTNDTVNNVEKVVIPQAKEGFLAVSVIARNTPNGAQDFALVAQGDLKDNWLDLVAQNVTLDKEEVDEGEPMTFSGDIVAMGNLPIKAFHYEVYLYDKENGSKEMFEEDTITDMKVWESRHFSHKWISLRGDWEFVVSVDTGHMNKEFSTLNNEVRLARFVKGYGMRADLLPQTVIVWPGLRTHIVVNVENTGNVVDTYTLSTEGIPVGWQVELDDDDITLARDKIGTINLVAVPPSAAKAGEVYAMTVRITSVGNSTYTSQLTSTATVGQVHGVRSNVADEGTSVMPGNTVVHLINITNTGNGVDTYNLGVYGIPPGWQTQFSEDQVRIEDNVTKVVTLEVTSPIKAVDGTIAKMDITVTTPTGESETLVARTQVRHTTGMDAYMWAEETVVPGGRIPFTVDILNLGNGNDDFYYTETVPAGWSTTFPLKGIDLSLEAFESYNASGELRCPRNARAGTYTFNVQIFTQEYVRELSRDVRVEEVYGASVITLSGVSAIYPGNESLVSLQVTSLCNLQTEFSVELVGAPPDWVVGYDPESAAVDTLRDQQFDITARPPKDATSRMYSLSIEISYGPMTDYRNFTLYVMEIPTTEEPDGGGGQNLLSDSTWLVVLVVIAVVVLVAVAILAKGRRGKGAELEFEGDEEPPPARARPLPPPPPPLPPPPPPPGRARGGRPLPPPPPPRTPDNLEELLADTPVMQRVSDSYDRYSADVAYASGTTLAQASAPAHVGDCPACGGKVMEYASGVLMCSRCGAQYTDR